MVFAVRNVLVTRAKVKELPTDHAVVAWRAVSLLIGVPLLTPDVASEVITTLSQKPRSTYR